MFQIPENPRDKVSITKPGLFSFMVSFETQYYALFQLHTVAQILTDGPKCRLHYRSTMLIVFAALLILVFLENQKRLKESVFFFRSYFIFPPFPLFPLSSLFSHLKTQHLILTKGENTYTLTDMYGDHIFFLISFSLRKSKTKVQLFNQEVEVESSRKSWD